ncbi:hypothetical protein GN244_ATG06284 [Phytophthora infestans]|uniref:Uncharacterized protein n=1 Tax=Phytophthora infestans TaxID=4787 RepID=A0A833TER4_PHYIN|nr:hypothetical protein GN244_ATG06284 [Phytophthora infestans]KAF4138186.1 hypothetical protein GN958_ATG12611 [Phytophthora infestans]
MKALQHVMSEVAALTAAVNDAEAGEGMNRLASAAAELRELQEKRLGSGRHERPHLARREPEEVGQAAQQARSGSESSAVSSDAGRGSRRKGRHQDGGPRQGSARW